MIYKESVLNPLPSSKHYGDFRFEVKKMAQILSVHKLPGGRFPMRKITEEVRSGNPTLYDLTRWYERAKQLTPENGKLQKIT